MSICLHYYRILLNTITLYLKSFKEKKNTLLFTAGKEYMFSYTWKNFFSLRKILEKHVWFFVECLVST